MSTPSACAGEPPRLGLTGTAFQYARHGRPTSEPRQLPVHTPKLHAVPPCTCNNGVTLCSRRSSQRAADSASMPAPSGVSPLPASGCQKPQPHSSRHAKYNPVDSAGRSSDSQCGQARRRAMRGRAHCSTHHTRGRALFERQVFPPHCPLSAKAESKQTRRPESQNK